MTDDIKSEDEFVASLNDLLRAADEGGVDVRGAWVCRNGDGHPDWEAVVTIVDDDERAGE